MLILELKEQDLNLKKVTLHFYHLLVVSVFFVGNVESTKTMTPIGKFKDELDELKNVKPGDVLRLYEETT